MCVRLYSHTVRGHFAIGTIGQLVSRFFVLSCPRTSFVYKVYRVVLRGGGGGGGERREGGRREAGGGRRQGVYVPTLPPGLRPSCHVHNECNFLIFFQLSVQIQLRDLPIELLQKIIKSSRYTVSIYIFMYLMSKYLPKTFSFLYKNNKKLLIVFAHLFCNLF